MRKLKLLIFLLTTVLAVDISTINNKFASNLYNILSKKDGNIFFSPISAYAVLAMVYLGASGNTTRSLQNVLNLPIPEVLASDYKNFKSELDKINDIKLYIANNVYVKAGYTLKQDFLSNVNNFFMANVHNIDFNNKTDAVHQINTWVESKTNNKIKNILSPDNVNEDTRFVLINAIYFKGLWKYPFNEHNTRQEKFYTSNSNSVYCQMMHTKRKYFYVYNSELDAKLLKIPYVNEHVNLVIILPNSQAGINSLENKLARKDLATLTQNMYEVEVVLSLPKFKIETNMDLCDTLTEMGLQNMFSSDAEFNNMLDSPEPIKVNKVIQKAYIEIDEKGSEASAATGLLARRKRSLDDSEVEFLVNRPFLFYIVHANLMDIFSGKLENPNSSIFHDEL